MHFVPYNWRLEVDKAQEVGIVADKALVQEAETVAEVDKQPPSAAK
jgi:hypothetical protein